MDGPLSKKHLFKPLLRYNLFFEPQKNTYQFSYCLKEIALLIFIWPFGILMLLFRTILWLFHGVFRICCRLGVCCVKMPDKVQGLTNKKGYFPFWNKFKVLHKKADFWQAAGFYLLQLLGWSVVGILDLDLMLYILFGGLRGFFIVPDITIDYLPGIVLFIPMIYSAVLYSFIYSGKKLDSVPYTMLGYFSAVVAVFGGLSCSLFFVAFLLTRSNKAGQYKLYPDEELHFFGTLKGYNEFFPFSPACVPKGVEQKHGEFKLFWILRGYEDLFTEDYGGENLFEINSRKIPILILLLIASLLILRLINRYPPDETPYWLKGLV